MQRGSEEAFLLCQLRSARQHNRDEPSLVYAWCHECGWSWSINRGWYVDPKMQRELRQPTAKP